MSVAIANDRWALSDDRFEPRRVRPVDQPGAGVDSAGAAPTPLFKGRILVVEDSAALRETLSDILTGNGYVVEMAEDGLAALDQLERSPFDVVILDLAMPRLDGIEMLRRIRDPHPAMVICSAFEYYTPEHVDEAVGSKVFRSLRKPVPPEELISVVADAVAAGRG